LLLNAVLGEVLNAMPKPRKMMLSPDELRALFADSKMTIIENLAVLSRSEHALIHRYYERVGVYLLGLSAQKPTPIPFDNPVMWGGVAVTEIDLVGQGVCHRSIQR
jgi:hypothetical protein